MEKQHSVQFFESFVKDIHKECQNFVGFDQMVEVSGYMCLEIDNVKKERYVLSELIQNSGSVISESYCTKVFRNCPTQRPPGQRGNVKRNMAPPNPAFSRSNQNRPGQAGQIRQQNMLQQNTRMPVSRAGQNQQMRQTSQVSKPGPNVPRNAQIIQTLQGSPMDQIPQGSPVSRKGPSSVLGRQRHNSVNTPLMNRQNNSQVMIAKNPNKPTFNQRLNQAANSPFGDAQKTTVIGQGVNQQGQGQCVKQQGQCTRQLSLGVNQQGQGQGVNQQGQGQCTRQLSQGVNRQGQSVSQLGQGERCQGQERVSQTYVQDPNLANLYGQNVFPQAVPQVVQDRVKTLGTAPAIIKQEEGQTCKEVTQTAPVNCDQQNIQDIKLTIHSSTFTGQDGVGQAKGYNTDRTPNSSCRSFQRKGSQINVQETCEAAQISTMSSQVASRSSSINVRNSAESRRLTVIQDQEPRPFTAPIPKQVFPEQRGTSFQGVSKHANVVQTLEKATRLSNWQIVEVEPEVSVVSMTPAFSAATLSTKPLSHPGCKDQGFVSSHPLQQDPSVMNQSNPLIDQGSASQTLQIDVTTSLSPVQRPNMSQTPNVNPAQMVNPESAPPVLHVQNMNLAQSYQKQRQLESLAQSINASLIEESGPSVSHLHIVNLQSRNEEPRSERVPQSSNYQSALPTCPTKQVDLRAPALKPSMSGTSPINLAQSSNQNLRQPTLNREMRPAMSGQNLTYLTLPSNIKPRAPIPIHSNLLPPVLHKMPGDRRMLDNSPSPQSPGDLSGPSSSDSFEITARRPVFLESSVVRSSLASSVHSEPDRLHRKKTSSMSQLPDEVCTEPPTPEWKTCISPHMDPNPEAPAVPTKKAKLSSEPAPEETSTLMSKSTKPVGKKGRESAAKKQVKKGRRKSTKPKKVDVTDLTSDEENYNAPVGLAPRRSLRSAQRTERQVYRDDDPDLSGGSSPGEN
ncbi:uncharacterized protein LOC124149150 [Haliotis rufescens]|uniref:uncharacterized protein LOC124149150 n=1 Tax=Haliotis rufescens TaxID=6454 RepID=UPI00201EECFA|nr:uncharacterized protein LOC124149150 [Haliotis rufescens]